MPIRVLVVDDSAFARKVIRECLSEAPDIEVVGIARSGLEAIEKIAELSPDVITLDLVMPDLDGIGVLRTLSSDGAPRVIVVSVSGADSELGVEALQSGAIDLVQKPTSLANDRLYEMRADLMNKVRAAAIARPSRVAGLAPLDAPAPVARTAPTHGMQAVVIGSSTGGPQALSRLLAAIPADFAVPMAIALHIPADYTDAMARRFDKICAIDVVEAYDGLEMRPGLAVLARGGNHLKLQRTNDRVVARVEVFPVMPFYPSVDVLFRSAVEAYSGCVLGVVLTGMGNDGLDGARAIRAAGGRVVTEAESSAIVYGMPQVVHAAGLANAEVPIEAIVPEILRQL
jgi:two-component system, chemotaxis family, protein-glutamate methylesterase/glutaminase